jgi:hypothetical protein
MADKSDPEIVIDDEPVVGAAPGTDAPDTTTDDSPSEDELRAQLKAAQERAEAADRKLEEERRAREAEKRASTTELTDTRLQTITSALDATAAKIKEVQAKRRAALEAGDYDAENAASDELMELKVKQSRLIEGKTVLEQQAEERKTVPADPVEGYIRNLSPRAQDWIRAHPEVVTDTYRNAELVYTHQKALRQGIREGSDDYFDYITREMGYGGTQPRQGTQEEPRTTERSRGSSSAPAAPVSRDVPSADGVSRKPGTIRLTAAEREAADIAGISYLEYARERDRLKAEGKFLTTH